VRERHVVDAIARTRRNPFLPAHPLSPRIAVSDALPAALHGAEVVLLVVPSQFVRDVARRIEAILPAGVPVVICSKGIEGETGALMTEVVAEVMPGAPLAVLSGPSFAHEVAAGQPTAVTIAATDAALAPHSLAARVAVTLGTPTFRPYLADDPIGVQVGGAVKNVLAIACGIVAARGLGANTRAALVTRGLAEIQRLALALGAHRDTLCGLAGLGDIALTCASEQSRNFSFGLALGGGDAASHVRDNGAVVEGAVNARSVVALARRLGVEMPICEGVAAIVHDGAPIDRIIEQLLTRPLRAESHRLERQIRVSHPAAMLQPATLAPA
jgi:glycerol-3-phosphate dehydrogenase (NAD(P)+)